MDQRRRAVVQGIAVATSTALAGCGGGGETTPETSRSATTRDASVASQRADTPAPRVAFDHGVASGDPQSDRVMLWTRVTPRDALPRDSARIPVTVTVALDQSLTTPVRHYETRAEPERDFCVKVDADGLRPDCWYYYRFSVGDQHSPVGRTRTFPETDAYTDRARFALVSCASYPHGLFSVYRAIAEHADLDFILHLGDYLYEYGPGEYGNMPGRDPLPAHEITTLADYRQRHAQYKADGDLRAVHQQFPMICIWDDHESANDSYRDGAENHDPATEGDWRRRKRDAVQAWFEWMPVREFPDQAFRIWRRFQYGNLIDLFMLDTRLEGRDLQLENPADPERNSADRHMISAAQMDWLLRGLDVSRSRWRMIGQQVMFAQLNIAEIPGIEDNPELRGSLVAINMDQWDGYAADRNRILNHLADRDIDNTVIFTGDIHTSWANEIYRNPAAVTGDLFDAPLAAEFITPAVTSPGFPDGAAEAAGIAVPVANPHIRYVEAKSRGFVLVDVTRQRTQAEYYYVRSITSEDFKGQLDPAKTKVAAVNNGSSYIIEDLPPSRPRTTRTALLNPRVTEEVC